MTNINKEGYIFIIILILISCGSFAISCCLGLIFLFLTSLCIYFFRDPVRIVPLGDSVVVSPADGLVVKIEEVNSPINSEIKVRCISIFLNILNVHVNRIPISGTIKAKEYKAGRFISANLDKASSENERQRIVIETLTGKLLIVDQIAGLIARRIVCYPKEQQVVKTGERFGIIRFGSRVNLYLPLDVKYIVKEGQTVVGGETIIADLAKEFIEHESFNSI